MSEEKRAKVYSLGSKYNERRAVDEKIKNTRHRNRKNEGLWGLSAGDYMLPFTNKQEPYFKTETPEQLVGTEVVLDAIVKQLFSNWQEGDEPLNFVDFGGQVGLTWCKLAFKYKDKVFEGKAEFIVTNLNMSKASLYGEVQREGDERYSENDIKAFEMGSDYVDYINADARELWEKYKGKVYLIHENHTLMHSAQPDSDILLLAETLNEKGVMLVNSRSYHPLIAEKDIFTTDINIGFEHGFYNARKTLTEVDGANRFYKVFAGRRFDTVIFDEDFPNSR
ncbi:hypothetical protein BH10PAT1_BH10PAT1_2380 [soil metagenome]